MIALLHIPTFAAWLGKLRKREASISLFSYRRTARGRVSHTRGSVEAVRLTRGTWVHDTVCPFAMFAGVGKGRRGGGGGMMRHDQFHSSKKQKEES